jgi:acetylornithine deacetylase/succinyl-diaminopimelate desuccinylase-like protein
MWRSHQGLIVALALVLVATGAPRLHAASAADPGNSPEVRATVIGSQASPSDLIPADHMRHYQDLATSWMREYLRIDTTNPPGNELQAAEWFKRILDAEGIENQLFQYAPGRADIWARVRATHLEHGVVVEGGSKRPIILLSHMDVVSSEPSHWLAPPFSGAIIGDSMYGRGAQDMKSLGLAQMLVLILLKREQPSIDRDVILLATADEEVHDSGTDWFIAHHSDLLDHAEFLLTEGGQNLLEGRESKYIGVDIAEKAPFWLHLVAHGESGHGSHPIEDSAPNRLLYALNRILAYRPELRVLPQVQQLLNEMAPYEPPARAAQLRNIRQALQNPSFRQSVLQDDSLNYLLHDTIAVTMLGGSKQTNVIPEEAWANLDVRLLPGEDPKEFLKTLHHVVNDSNVTIEPLDGFAAGNSSPIATPLFSAIRRVSQHYFPGTPVLPRMASGYNESQRYRQLDIVCYGYNPYLTTTDESSTGHGDNERIRLEELRRGFRVLYDVVLDVN